MKKDFTAASQFDRALRRAIDRMTSATLLSSTLDEDGNRVILVEYRYGFEVAKLIVKIEEEGNNA